MYGWNKLNKNQNGQAALEAAIILIAFVVVASVFAFAILSAGQSSTQKGESAIYAGLASVQSSLEVKGAVIAKSTAGTVDHIIFDVATVEGGSAVNLDPSALVIAYRDASAADASTTFTTTWITPSDKASTDTMLKPNELAEIDVTVPDDATLDVNTPFTLEVKPTIGGTLVISRTLPAAIDPVMELR